MKILTKTILKACTVAVILLSFQTLNASAATFTTALHLGSKNTQVTLLQSVLTSQNIYIGPITGYFGVLTRQAVIDFQNANALDPVGTVGPKTRALLNTLLSTSAPAPQVVPATTTPDQTSIVSTNVNSNEAALITAANRSRRTRKPQATTTLPISAPLPIPTPAPTPLPTPATPGIPTSTPIVLPQTQAMQWGIFPGDATLASVESQVGKQANIAAAFVGFSDPFPTYLGSVCAGNASKSLLLFWENYGYSLDNITAGKYDTYLNSFAQQTKMYTCPVIISLFHEMNGNWDDWDGTMPGNSPAKIIAAWRHIHAIFAAAQVANVKWAFAVNNVSVPNVAGNQIADYYPGDAYVDYVGIDGFNFGNPWQTFGQVFDAAVAQVQVYQKPIYLFSIGSAPGTQKAAWITEGLGSHVKTYANVKGWVWFNYNGGGSNWLIDSDSASLAAFKAILP